MNNRLQTAIVWLAVLEVIICCFFMPIFLFRMQEINLSREIQEEDVPSTNLGFFSDSIFYSDTSGLSLEEKINTANSYDSTVTSIYLEKGEKYTANQICSIAAGELMEITDFYAKQYPLMERLYEMQIWEPIQACGIFLEELAHEEFADEIGYADVETVDEVDADLNSIYEDGNDEVRVEAMMYINSSEPDQAFIVWQLNYYNLEEDTTLFLLFDDETGRLLSITGSLSDFQGEQSYSLYTDSRMTASMIKDYYQQVEEEGP